MEGLTEDIIQALLKEAGNIEAAVRLMVPIESGNLKDNIKVQAERTDKGVKYIIIGSEYMHSRTIRDSRGFTRTVKPREYLWGDGSVSYVGPLSLEIKPGGSRRLKNGKVLQSFILEPIEEAVKRVTRVILAKYNIMVNNLSIDILRGG